MSARVWVLIEEEPGCETPVLVCGVYTSEERAQAEKDQREAYVRATRPGVVLYDDDSETCYWDVALSLDEVSLDQAAAATTLPLGHPCGRCGKAEGAGAAGLCAACNSEADEQEMIHERAHANAPLPGSDPDTCDRGARCPMSIVPLTAGEAAALLAGDEAAWLAFYAEARAWASEDHLTPAEIAEEKSHAARRGGDAGLPEEAFVSARLRPINHTTHAALARIRYNIREAADQLAALGEARSTRVRLKAALRSLDGALRHADRRPCEDCGEAKAVSCAWGGR